MISPRLTTTEALVEQFTSRYSNPKTAADYRRTLRRLFATTGKRHPEQLTEADLLAFCTATQPANNTVYQRRTMVTTFCRWCHRSGVTTHDPSDELSERNSPLRTFRRTYGKVQARNPGRWLTHPQAYEQLIGACQDGTVAGLRDELAIRLGLLGMRCSEIASLNLDNLRHLPTITWTGKGHKPRQAIAGPALADLFGRYLDQYPDAAPTDPLICPQVLGATRQGGPPRLAWHHPASPRTVFNLVAQRAKLAGLGHVAPHDLRRSAAGILHNSKAADGSHYFDLLDIQRVLGHSDPATTMRSYLEPLDTDVLDRAAAVLD